MHPKEFKKTKNNTGRLTHLSLPNSEIHVGIDFTDHPRINALINDPGKACHVLYPGDESIKLNTTPIGHGSKESVIFIIDATWACSKKILRLSRNLSTLPKVSFDHTKVSAYKIKQQPKSYCLSTIESTLCVLELLSAHRHEQLDPKQLSGFLEPFEAMVSYQIGRLECEHNVRFSERPETPLRAKRGKR